MKTTLVGYTGFVGSNLDLAHDFDLRYNSKNIEDAFNQQHELVVYAGVRAEKFLANTDSDGDLQIVKNAAEQIRRMNPKKLVLISTVDVYKNPCGVDENTEIDTVGLHPYGYNRFLLEQWACEIVKDCHVVRLPGLFGAGLKKNFIYDMITLVPAMLKQEKYDELCEKNPLIKSSYSLASNGFYKLCDLSVEHRGELKGFFEKNDFNSLKFTDSRAVYQFYNLANLWRDINTVVRNNIRLQNISSEPVSAAEIFKFIRNSDFVNELAQKPIYYDWRSIYADVFNGKNGYIYDKETILKEIKNGIKNDLLVATNK